MSTPPVLQWLYPLAAAAAAAAAAATPVKLCHVVLM